MEKSWQDIREKDIKILYERTVKAYEPDKFHFSYEQFRHYVTQADLGPPYVNAPSENE